MVVPRPGLVVRALARADNATCCSFDGLRTDLSTYIPQLLHYSPALQQRLTMSWPAYTDCDAYATAYETFGTCLPAPYNQPQQYFEAATTLLETNNVWAVLRNYNFETCSECFFRKDKLTSLLAARGFKSQRLPPAR